MKTNYIQEQIRQGNDAKNKYAFAVAAFKTFEIDYASNRNWKRVTKERKAIILQRFIRSFSEHMTREFAVIVCNAACLPVSEFYLWNQTRFFGESEMKTTVSGDYIGNDEKCFDLSVEEEKELAEVIEEMVSRCIKTTFTKRNWGRDGLPEDFECFLRIDADGVSLVSCG
jgi:hypothetical protein